MMANFANYQPGFGDGVLAGYKCWDMNRNGSCGDENNLLAGWTIYLDTNDNGQFDTDEPSTTTDEWGYYMFTALPAGDYVVREVQQAGWEQTAPSEFIAEMNGGQVVPPVSTMAHAETRLRLNEDTGQVTFRVDFWDVYSTTTGAGLYIGNPGTNGTFIADLVAASGQTAEGFYSPIEGTLTLDVTGVTALLAGQVYVSLSSTDYPDGEIRGQVIPPDGSYRVHLNTSEQRYGMDFGNYLLGFGDGVISGYKSWDKEGDGFPALRNRWLAGRYTSI
jgi:hypothetical protein